MEEETGMRTRLAALFGVAALVVGMPSIAGAITWGRPDVNNEYPNVASVRGIVEAQNLARISCSGSLLHADADKVVILTAAHCTDAWADAIAAGTIDSVGVSFDQNNQVNGTTTDATFYVRGGVPISFPAKDAPFETFDYGLVVFPAMPRTPSARRSRSAGARSRPFRSLRTRGTCRV